MRWIKYPFIKITIAATLGILVDNHLTHPELPYNYMLLSGLVIFIIFFIISILTFPNKRFFYGILASFGFFFLGFISSNLSYQLNKPSVDQAHISSISFYTAVIYSKAENTEKTTRYEVKTIQAKYDDKWSQFSNMAILYFNGKSTDIFEFGDTILLKGHPSLIDRQKNPYAFDYGLFLQRRNIFLQDFISPQDYLVLNRNPSTSIRYTHVYIGDYFERTLVKYLSSERELNMAKAMSIGRRNEISPEMDSIYQATGTSHILAVSGLHVGIIYLVFASIFSFLKYRRPRWVYYVLLLLAIWSFAIITGLSPSVQRASAMFSFVIVGELLMRRGTIFNSIFASAFFLLLFDPNLIYSVSFQLSYTAVLGIILLYKKIYTLIFIESNIVDFFWKITAISLSVQIATLPIIIFYFHQFSTVSLLSNLIAIPTAAIVLIGSLLLFVTSPLGIIPKFIGIELEGWIYSYNELMLLIGKSELATIKNLYLEPMHVALLMCAIGFLIAFLEIRKLYILRYFVVVLLTISALNLSDYYKKSNQEEIVFYSVPGKQHVDILLGTDCYTNSIENQQDVSYNISPYRMHKSIINLKDLKELPNAKPIGENTLIYLKGKSILLFNELESLAPQLSKVSIDYLVVGKTALPVLHESLSYIKYQHLVLDSSIDAETCDLYISELNERSNVYSIEKDGALIVRI